MHTLTIKTIGHFYNEFPKFRITHNDKIIFDGYVKDNVFEIALTDTPHNIVLEHYDKWFGKNRRWDTKIDNDKIIEDRKIVVKDMLLDDISLTAGFNKLTFVQTPTENEPIVQPYNWNSEFNFNGKIVLNITPTPLIWVTNLLHKKPIFNVSYFSNHSKLFHYEDELRIIKEIEDLLNANV